MFSIVLQFPLKNTKYHQEMLTTLPQIEPDSSEKGVCNQHLKWHAVHKFNHLNPLYR